MYNVAMFRSVAIAAVFILLACAGCGSKTPVLTHSARPINTNSVHASKPVEGAIITEPHSRVAHTAAACRGRIYFFGGISEDGAVPQPKNVECYEPATERWTSLSALPTSRNFAAAAELDGAIYLVGGLDDNAVSMGLVEKYDPATDTWTTLAPLGVPRSRLALAVLNGKIYAVGGLEGAEHVRCADSRALEVYDPVANTWTRLPDMPTARHALAAAGHAGRIYALGGYATTTTGQSNVVESFDPKTNEWRKESPMLSARGFFAAFSLGDDLLAIGNLNAPAAPERLTPLDTGPGSLASWQPCAAPDLRRFRFAAVTLNGLVYAFGGEGDTSPNVRIFDAAGDLWIH